MPRPRFLPIALVLALACSGGGGPTESDVPRDVVLTNVEFCSAGGESLRADLHFPSDPAPRPVVVFVHGGAWVSGTRTGSMWLGQVQGPLLARGFVIVTIDYRLAPEHRWPAQIQDVRCAIRFLRAHAGEYGIDPGRIAAMGTSAGGHLAAMAGTADDGAFGGGGEWPGFSGRVRAVVSLYGPADLTSDDWEQWQLTVFPAVFGTANPASPILAQASPINHVTPDDPPHLLIHGDSDELVPVSQSEAFFARLDAAGVEAELVVVAGANHGLREAAIDPSRSEIRDRIVAFLVAEVR